MEQDDDRSAAARAGALEARLERAMRGRTGLGVAAAASAAESTIVPIPIEAAALPVMTARPGRAMALAWALLVGSAMGASLLYLLAFGLQDRIAELVAWFDLGEAWEAMRARMETEGAFATVFLISLSVAPMQLAALGAGASGAAFPVFLAAILASRGIRYFGLALLCRMLGRRVEALQGSSAVRAALIAGGIALLWLGLKAAGAV